MQYEQFTPLSMRKSVVALTPDEPDSPSEISPIGKHSSPKILPALVLLGYDEGDCPTNRSINGDIFRVPNSNMRKIYRVKKRFLEEGSDVALSGKTRMMPMDIAQKPMKVCLEF